MPFVIEKAQRITQREIIEGLTRLEEDQKNLDKRIDHLHLTHLKPTPLGMESGVAWLLAETLML